MTELAVPNGNTAIDILSTALDDEASGFNPQPVVIETVHKQGMFQFPSLDPVRRLEGVILASRMIRVFFPRMGNEEDSEALLALTSNRPFCSSADYFHGNMTDADVSENELAVVLKDKIAEGGGDCLRCPLNEWESVSLLGKSGRGKACAELRRLLFWRQGMTVPAILPVSSTSIRNWDAYCSSLETAGFKHNKVVTEISAEVTAHPARKDWVWSILHFNKSGDITEEIAQELVTEVMFKGVKQMLATALVDLFRGREISIEDYPTNGSATEGDEL